jgi:hypothetical protein
MYVELDGQKRVLERSRHEGRFLRLKDSLVGKYSCWLLRAKDGQMSKANSVGKSEMSGWEAWLRQS